MAHAFTDTLTVLAELQVKPDRLDDFLAYTVANLPISRAAPGNLRFEMLLDPARPGRVLFYEEWQSAEAQQAYLAWRIAQGDLTTLMTFLAAEPVFTALRAVAA